MILIQMAFLFYKMKKIGPTLLLLILSILFFYDLFQGRFIFSERDLAPYFIPQRYLWVESIKRGDFPLWDPYQFTGHPFFANPQNAILYPINGLFFLLPFDIAFNSIIILHFFLGGLFIYILLRDLNVNQTGSLISGLIFMLSGYLLSVHSLLTILLSVIWTPLVIMFFTRSIRNPGIRNEIFVAIFMAISFLGGGIEIVYGNFFLIIIISFFSFESSRLYKSFLTRVKSLFFISLIFFILSSIQLIPFIELWNHSIRGKGIPFEEATIWSFSPKDFLLFFLPDAYGYFLDMHKYWLTQCWLKTLYTGGLPFILSISFFISPVPNSFPNRKFFLFLMLFSLFLSLGKYNPLYQFFYTYIPFFNGIRYPVKFLYIFVLCISITAGLGFYRLTQLSSFDNIEKIKRILLILLIISGAILTGFVLGHKEFEVFLKNKGIDFPEFNYISINLFHIKRFFFYLTIFFLIIRVGVEFGWKIWINGILLLFLIGDLFGNMGFYGKEKIEDYFRKTKIFEIVSKEKGLFRVFSTPKTISLDTPILIGKGNALDLIKEKHLPSFNLLYGIHGVWGVDVIRLKRIDELYRLWTTTTSIIENNLINLFGARYIISITPINENSHFELIYTRLEGLDGDREKLLKDNTIKLYKNLKALPRAWLVNKFKIMDSKEILLTLFKKEFRPDEIVLLEDKPPFPIEGEGRGEVKLLFETNNRLKLKIKAEKDCILVLSDTYLPGWKVFIDKRREEILRANYNFRAVPIKAGVHDVEFIYAPFSFRLGMAITSLGIFCLLFGLFFNKRKGEEWLMKK